ncbi:hypothetical protein TRFO_23541 [Tritrichomonas foetus]|uniref:Uncharacterized protein n=1 Tax=Tritrichomonas foetus TaxID=1144522 RepID=A0A1J4KB12_9EUKA|nr:hypothetical protein TRFO_23541 [Tritrichomonas foetus]|eukprot:OHT08088.1 hypothetical protein TRFO_23541 [Tritrichomonas foetus]
MDFPAFSQYLSGFEDNQHDFSITAIDTPPLDPEIDFPVDSRRTSLYAFTGFGSMDPIIDPENICFISRSYSVPDDFGEFGMIDNNSCPMANLPATKSSIDMPKLNEADIMPLEDLNLAPSSLNLNSKSSPRNPMKTIQKGTPMYRKNSPCKVSPLQKINSPRSIAPLK